MINVLSLITPFLVLLAAAAIAQAEEPGSRRLEVFKAKRELQLFEGERLLKTYHVALGDNPLAQKQREGDRATPEGTYYICVKNPKSRFHLSLGISYPGPQDAARGLQAGLISRAQHDTIVQAQAHRATPDWYTALGGEVFIHGGGSQTDWTWGCIALENAEMDELYPLVPVGTPVTIHP